ncbi:MAG: DNA mismatch repair protein MutS [Bacteroidales bacterium]|nr:DNA mismatch repair protein MutS [Bacteroidales bacterium]MCF8405805.1 DNA mismatch repair protein MutS [Bacteroidales bacterium]
MAKAKVAETPLMKQYNAIKQKYPDALLLFRVGDFYETFGEDAIKTSKILGIVLTRRANGAAAYIELAGFPHHSIDTYLPKLVRAGLRVAICDQLEDPKLTKKIVKRGVTELVTPGVTFNDNVLENTTNNFLAAIHYQPDKSGIAFLDVTTGEFLLAQGNDNYIDKLLQSFKPSEIILQRNKLADFSKKFGDFITQTFEEWIFNKEFSEELLLKKFGTKSLKGFGIEMLPYGIIAAGVILHYLKETHHDNLDHISSLSRIEEDNFVWLDRFTIKNLELLSSSNDKSPTLIETLDHTISPMGSRLLKRWMVLPLKNRAAILQRTDTVRFLLNQSELSESLRKQIKLIGDLERLISKVSIGRVNPREVLKILDSLQSIQQIIETSRDHKSAPFRLLIDQLNSLPTLQSQIEKTIKPEPSVVISKGNVIKQGISEELDELRRIMFSGKDYLVEIQQRETERTGISSLKISYNNVFGYYLEVTNTHKDKVPPEWHRKQTLTNSERYITEELKEYESKILGAEEKIIALETKLFNELIVSLAQYIEPIQVNARKIAALDVLLSFAFVAEMKNYCEPDINDSFKIDIRQGRHPVIEEHMPDGEEYIPNDIYLDNETQQILIITGPNMSGKSALLRQTALIVLLAQMGSFVPASSAKIGIVDKIFTRIGASDNISLGESTFMVEMIETSSILNNLSNRSLILLDEIGRGTSTYDGISIAWAISEFLHQHPLFKAKVLFATHYHELNEMAADFTGIKNFHVSIKEVNNRIIFLRKIVAGGSEHSFGIHVAKMAGMPQTIINRATELLGILEKTHSNSELKKQGKSSGRKSNDDFQLSFIQLDDPLLLQIKEDILNTDINTLTPVEALMKLNEIKKLLGKK